VLVLAQEDCMRSNMCHLIWYDLHFGEAFLVTFSC
jgi:hypothetical protein